MLNEDYKNTTIRELEKANGKYMLAFKQTVNDMNRLFQSRQRAIRTILYIEKYINSLANKPREYEIKLGRIKLRYLEFNNRVERIKKLDDNERQVKYNRGIATGALVGVSSAAFAPSAAMAIAMTFGTASTGTAIASLSGVAATNAALAWLGGGTVAAGGAGMIGGQALLTMAGPIGWAIGGVSIAGGFLMKAFANKDVAEKAEKATRTIIQETERIREKDATVCLWNRETIKLSNEITKKLTVVRRKNDYSIFNDNDKQELIILMNTTELLSKKLGDTIS